MTDLAALKIRAFNTISEILFPAGDRDAEWDNETIERVADVVREVSEHL